MKHWLLLPLLMTQPAFAEVATPDVKVHITIPQRQEANWLEEAWQLYTSNAFLMCAAHLDRHLGEAKRHAIALPPNIRAWLAIMYERCAVEVADSGATEAGLEILRTALRLAPKSYSIQYHLGALLHQAGYLPDARAALKRAIALAQPANRLTATLGELSLEQEAPEAILPAAQDELKELKELEP